MTPTQPSGLHQQWVAKLFEKILKILGKLNWKQKSPSLFLVYAHDNHAIDKKADAEVAQQLIQWLRELGATIYSDRTAMGNSPAGLTVCPDTAKSAHDILSSQLCLLPTDSVISKKVDHVILCGSELLGYYLSSEYYQETYYPRLKSAYEGDPQHPEAKLRDCVHEQVKAKDDFHHVLTELAFLEIRANEASHHGILPVLFNGKSEESFPPFIIDSTTIRIEETAYREAGCWKGQTTYQDQGLHKGFFKLLKQLWVSQERTIQILGEGVYDHCIQVLQSQSVPKSTEAFMSFMEDTFLKAQDRLIQEFTSTLDILTDQQFRVEMIKTVQDTLQEKLTGPTVEPDTLRTALHQATRDRLTIQRVSGQTLPMAQCYINLAVVEHQQVKTEEKPEKPTSAFHRLPSFEAMEKTNLQKPILLEDLFNARKLNNGTTGVPQRILIRGRAGIGKTTLSKKSVYEYMENQRWRNQFDWLLWIPLRKLKGKPEHYLLETLLYDEYFCQHSTIKSEGEALAQALCRQIQASPTQTLLILDGWDEIAQEQPIACLKGLLNHPAVIITSRPYGVDLSQIRPDLELETIGFSPDNVEEYLKHPDIVQPAEADEIKQFIQSNPSIRALVNVPILLDALCYSWDYIKDYIKQGRTKTHTMTGLYQAMVHKLWSKDILRLDKQENGKPLTAKTINTIRRPERLEQLVQSESDCLGALALNGLHADQIEFTPYNLDDVITQLEKAQGMSLPSTLEQNLNELSCLHVERGAPAANPLSYHFLHLSFQEFFAALWLVKHLTHDKPLGLFKDSKNMTAHDFIQRNKYNPRYELIWWFTAGLLSDEALTRFFKTLDQGPQDLIGIQHQRLIMHCLQESNGRLPSNLQQSLESSLYEWLRFEVNQMDDDYYSTSSLGRQAAFPEALLCQLLEELSHQDRAKSILARTLEQRPALSEKALTYLITLLKDEDWDVRRSAARVLSQRPVWEGYRLLLTQEPSFLKEHYSQWLIKRNFQQIVPLYIAGDMLYFSTSTELKSVSLTGEAAFRRTILQAQDAVGMPLASRVKTTQSTASVQGNAVVLSHPASSFSSTLFHRSEGPHDSEPHDNPLKRPYHLIH